MTNMRSKRVQVPDINILPMEYRRPTVGNQTWLLLLVVLVFGYAVFALYPLGSRVRTERATIEGQLTVKQQELKRLQALEPQVVESKEALAKLEARKTAVLESWGTFEKSRVNWRLVLDGIQGSVPKDVTIDAVTQKDMDVAVHGVAPSLSSVAEYANSLRRLGLSKDVGMTYEVRPDGGVSFELYMTVKAGGRQ